MGQDAVVLLHAFPLDARMWEGARAALEPRYRVIAPDLAGFGGAAGRPSGRSVDEHADDVARTLDELGIEKAVVGGLSMGGYVALALAARHPERLSGLVLADTRASADSSEAKAGRDRAIGLVQSGGLGTLVGELLPKLLSPGADPALTSRVRAIAVSQDPDGIARALLALRDRPDRSGLLPSLAVPTLVLVGEKDVLTPPDEARALASRIPDAELAVIPGAGHLASLENPEAFHDALVGWLRRKDAEAGGR